MIHRLSGVQLPLPLPWKLCTELELGQEVRRPVHEAGHLLGAHDGAPRRGGPIDLGLPLCFMLELQRRAHLKDIQLGDGRYPKDSSRSPAKHEESSRRAARDVPQAVGWLAEHKRGLLPLERLEVELLDGIQELSSFRDAANHEELLRPYPERSRPLPRGRPLSVVLGVLGPHHGVQVERVRRHRPHVVLLSPVDPARGGREPAPDYDLLRPGVRVHPHRAVVQTPRLWVVFPPAALEVGKGWHPPPHQSVQAQGVAARVIGLHPEALPAIHQQRPALPDDLRRVVVPRGGNLAEGVHLGPPDIRPIRADGEGVDLLSSVLAAEGVPAPVHDQQVLAHLSPRVEGA
mmetsp:Transcript_7089/g.24390  ORF Transcript_7089/g.24390 Transcript_7089/m.24390 type:complete len:346 (-) Transcript_7089:1337-2374(-)